MVKGEICITDRAYLQPDRIAVVLDEGADVLIRVGGRNARWLEADGEPVDLLAEFRKASETGLMDRRPCPRPSPWEIFAWFLRQGVESPALLYPELPRRAPIVFHADEPFFTSPTMSGRMAWMRCGLVRNGYSCTARSIAATARASPSSARMAAPIACGRSRIASSESAVWIAAASVGRQDAVRQWRQGKATRGEQASPRELVSDEGSDEEGFRALIVAPAVPAPP